MACPPSVRAAAAVWCRHASSPASACTADGFTPSGHDPIPCHCSSEQATGAAKCNATTPALHNTRLLHRWCNMLDCGALGPNHVESGHGAHQEKTAEGQQAILHLAPRVCGGIPSRPAHPQPLQQSLVRADQQRAALCLLWCQNRMADVALCDKLFCQIPKRLGCALMEGHTAC